MEEATTLYYTLSTIAQSLAAAIALLATFVLYRVQALNTETERREDALLDLGFETGVRTKAQDARLRGDVKGFLEITSVQITTPNEKVDYARRRLKALYKHERSLMRTFWLSVLLTVALIGASVVGLTRVPEIVDGELTALILDGCLWWFGACLVSYAWLMKAALSSTSRHER